MTVQAVFHFGTWNATMITGNPVGVLGLFVVNEQHNFVVLGIQVQAYRIYIPEPEPRIVLRTAIEPSGFMINRILDGLNEASAPKVEVEVLRTFAELRKVTKSATAFTL